MSDNWWEQAPLVDKGGGDKWWEAAPIVQKAAPKEVPVQGNQFDQAEIADYNQTKKTARENPELRRRITDSGRLDELDSRAYYRPKLVPDPGHPGMYLPEDTGAGTAALLGYKNWALPGLAPGVTALEATAPGKDSPFPVNPNDPFTKRYSDVAKGEDIESDKALKEHPWAYGAGVIGGLTTGGGLLPRIGMKALSPLLNYALEGGVYGGLYGASGARSLHDLPRDVIYGVGSGAVLGGALGKAGDALGSYAKGLKEARTPVDTHEIDALSRRFAPRGEEQFPLSYGQKTQNPAIRSEENLMTQGANGPKAQAEGVALHDAQYGDVATDKPSAITGAFDTLTSHLGAPDSALPPGERLRETARSAVTADRTGQAWADRGEADMTAARGDHIAEALRDGNAPAGPPLDTAERIGNTLQERASAHADATDQAYAAARAIPGEWSPAAVADLHDAVVSGIQDANRSRNSPIVIDADSTPLASRMMADLQQRSQMTRGLNQVGERPTTGFSGDEIERIRQKMNDLQGNARGADRTAIRGIKQAFDDHLIRAAQRGDFSGDAPALLQHLREARQSYGSYQQTYRPQPIRGDTRNDPRSFLKLIIDNDWHPQEVMTRLFTDARLQGVPKAARTLSYLRDVLGHQSPEWAAMKDAQWASLRHVEGGLNRRNAQQTASTIEEFLNGRGNPMAAVLYSAEERAAMARWARELRGFSQRSTATDAHIQALSRIADGNMAAEEIVKQALGGAKDNFALLRAYRDMSPDAAGTLREAHLRQMTKVTPGGQAPGAGTIANRITEGMKDSTLVRELYTPEQVATIHAFAKLMDHVATQHGTLNASGTAAPVMRMAGKLASSFVTRAIGAFGMNFMLAGGNPFLASAASGSQEVARMIMAKIAERSAGKRAGSLFAGTMPKAGAGRRTTETLLRKGSQLSRAGSRGYGVEPALTEGPEPPPALPARAPSKRLPLMIEGP